MENILHNPVDAYLFEPFLYFVAIVFTLTFFHKEPRPKTQAQVSRPIEPKPTQKTQAQVNHSVKPEPAKEIKTTEFKNNFVKATSGITAQSQAQVKPTLTSVIKESFTNPTPIIDSESLAKQNEATYSAIFGKLIQENINQVTTQPTASVPEKTKRKTRKPKTGFASLV